MLGRKRKAQEVAARAASACLHNWQNDGYRESGDGRYILEESCANGCGKTRERKVHGS
jgi:hypothetical protein